MKAAELAKAVGCCVETVRRHADKVGGKRVGMALHFPESAPNRLRNHLNQLGEEQVAKMVKTQALNRALKKRMAAAERDFEAPEERNDSSASHDFH
jgi:hypothetical protein